MNDHDIELGLEDAADFLKKWNREPQDWATVPPPGRSGYTFGPTNQRCLRAIRAVEEMRRRINLPADGPAK